MRSLHEIARNAAASQVMQQMRNEEQREAIFNKMANMPDDGRRPSRPCAACFCG